VTMDKPGGYAGNILTVDLTTGSISEVPLAPELIDRFLGGAGINARLAYENIEPQAPPLSPENALVFGVGPMVGTLAPGACKANITGKSPSSQFIASSGSGHLGMLKFAGYDHVVVTGRADRPVYLRIGDTVEIREAGHIWGRDTWETTDAIWNELGREHTVLSIGPAGENLVRDAGVIANKYSAFARTGTGAVMGSKNLKAIAAYGSSGITVANPKRFMELANEIHQKTVSLPAVPQLRQYGTLLSLEPMARTGSVLYRNFRQAAGEEFLRTFDLEEFQASIDHGTRSCLSCPVGCKHYLHWNKGEYAGLALSISCAAVATFSAVNCGVMGWPEVLEFAQMCNRLGMDYMTVSGLVAMAIELYEKGIISEADTGGMALNWDSATVHRLVPDIAYRRGIGDVLANGLVEASRQIGKEAEECAVNFKGLTPGGDPRSLSTPIFSLLTNATGHSSHINQTLFGMTRDRLVRYCRRLGMSDQDMERVLTGPAGYNPARLTRWAEDYSFVLECLGMCQMDFYQRFDIGLWAELYSAATGIDIDGAGLLEAAARGRDMRKAFNVREGATRSDDRMPARFLSESIEVGDGLRPPLGSSYIDGLITEYYQERGWDPRTGDLTPEKTAALGL
jgi:aldehyde:ferredoxin oxidoreductase